MFERSKLKDAAHHASTHEEHAEAAQRTLALLSARQATSTEHILQRANVHATLAVYYLLRDRA